MKKTLEELDAIHGLLDIKHILDRLKNEYRNIDTPLEMLYHLNPFNAREVEMIRYCLQYYSNQETAFDCCVLKIVWTRLSGEELILKHIYNLIDLETVYWSGAVFEIDPYKQIYFEELSHFPNKDEYKAGVILRFYYKAIFDHNEYPKARQYSLAS